MQALSSKAHNGSVRAFQASSVRGCVRVARTMPVVEARVVIRFQRYGRKKLPFYRLVATDSRTKRDGAPLEFLGWYDPLKKETNLNAPAIKQWLSNGAKPSATVEGLLKKAYVIQPDKIKVEIPKDAVKV